MLQKIKDEIEYAILKFIEYDNQHHCFSYFVLGFTTAVLIVQTVILIILIKMF